MNDLGMNGRRERKKDRQIFAKHLNGNFKALIEANEQKKNFSNFL